MDKYLKVLEKGQGLVIFEKQEDFNEFLEYLEDNTEIVWNSGAKPTRNKHFWGYEGKYTNLRAVSNKLSYDGKHRISLFDKHIVYKSEANNIS